MFFKNYSFLMKQESFATLKNTLEGSLILPADAAYSEARKVYNGMIDKYPAAIALCKSAEDVQACVRMARQHNLLLAVRGGGHNAGGLGIADDALVIDLSMMKAIQVHKEAKTIRLEGGALLKEMDAATYEVGMCVPAGIFGTTGVGGLTLGGGLGHLTRQYGLTIDNLLEAEVILANGDRVTASASQHPDLFWALRGGGGNFGVVISFLFRLNPTHTVYAGPMLWELDDTAEMMAWYHEFMSTAPDNINGFFNFLTVPPVAPFPEHLHLKKMCGVVWCYAGDMDKAEAVFQPIRAVKTPALDFVGPLPVPALQTMFDALYPPGLQWYWKADFMNRLDENMITIHHRFAAQMPTPFCMMHLYPIDGAAARVGKSETAWNYRDAQYALVIVGITDNPAESNTIKQWASDYWKALHPYAAGGAYVNFMMEEGESRVRASYGDNYERLAAIKAKYDPGNLFRVNQNIKPAKAVAMEV